MAPASGFFGLTLEKYFRDALAATADLENETTIKTLLVTSAHTPNFDTMDFRDDVTGNEVASGGGYTTGGVVLTTTDITLASGILTYDAADSAWTTATITARGCVCYAETAGADSTDPLIYELTFGGSDIISTAGNFTIVYNASGIFTIDYVP